MVVVPDDSAVEVEAMIQNRDIGFVREGQAVRVKLDAFPFTDYGLIEGGVESISRDAVEPPASSTQRGNESGSTPIGPIISRGCTLIEHRYALRAGINRSGQGSI
jgi:hemolysin D